MRPIVSIAALVTSIALAACASSPESGPDSPATAENAEAVQGAKPLDRNADGAISLEELVGAATDRLAKDDANGDGVLTKDEMRRKGHHGRRGPPPGLDADADGKVSLAESEAMVRGHFAAMDEDKDGKIAVADMPPHRPGAPDFKVDANADGQITVDELLAGHRAHFTERDADKDGMLAGDEMKRPGPPPGEGERGVKEGKREGKEHGGKAHRGPPRFEEVDADADGKVTLGELEASARKHFAELDADRNGLLEDKEMPLRGHKGKGKRGAPGERGERGPGERGAPEKPASL